MDVGAGILKNPALFYALTSLHFRESATAEAQFPRISALGNPVNRGEDIPNP
jgi:hypothetical protein